MKTTIKKTDHFFYSHLIFPVIIYSIIISVIYFLKLDYQLSFFLFDLSGGAWSLKDHFFTETLIHVYGKYLSIVFYLAIIVVLLLSYKNEKIKSYKKGLIYLVISTLLATLLISFLKSITRIDCPWSMSGLGGEQEYEHWIVLLFKVHDGGKCFPAGHASAAYAFFSLYFFARFYFLKYASLVFLVVLTAGIIFGFSQQLRGAHFLSHDVTTAFLCWLINLTFYYFLLGKAKTNENF